jgi:TonB family protein
MKKYFAAAAVIALTAFAVVRAQDPQDPSNPADLVKSAEAAVRRADYTTADRLYAKAAAGADRPEIASALLYLGVRAMGSGNILAGEGFFERVIKIDPKGPQAGPALSWLASMRAKNDPAGAEDLFKQALEAENPTSLEYVDTLRKYSLLVRKMGREADSQELEARAREAQMSHSSDRRGAAKPLDAGVYRVGGGVTAPSLIAKREPEYTEGARSGGVQGTTVLGVDIGPDGVARNFEILRSLEPGLDQKAIDAVQQWKFKPGTKDGQPVTVRATIEVNFRLM